MKLENDSKWILSEVELQLCARVLGQRDWSLAQVRENGAPIEQRLLNAFLHLCDLGLLLPGERGFRAAENLKNRFAPILSPTLSVSLQCETGNLSIYGDKERMVLIESVNIGNSRCVLSECRWEDGFSVVTESMKQLSATEQMSIRAGNGERERRYLRREGEREFHCAQQAGEQLPWGEELWRNITFEEESP